MTEMAEMNELDSPVDARGSGTSLWPEALFQFAYFPERDARIRELAEMAEEENWGYNRTTSEYERPVLFNFLRYTYSRLADENKIALSENGQSACFNTGLVSPNQEPIFATFDVNRVYEAQPWYFKGWFREGHAGMRAFPELPPLAHYFDDPACLVFDPRIPFRINVEHILTDDARDRFPEPFRSMSDYALQTHLRGAVDNAKTRVARNYKTAIPQFYRGRVQLLLPLCLSDAKHADLAMVVERHSTFYQASTCLTLDMAYSNARLLAKPDRDWLQP